jgi:hypothetical protein
MFELTMSENLVNMPMNFSSFSVNPAYITAASVPTCFD